MKIKVKYVLPLMILSHIGVWYLVFFFLKVPNFSFTDTSFIDFMIHHQGEFYATLMMRLISFNISLACRFKYAEKLFYGLDKAYLIHKYTGYLVFFLVLMHNATIISYTNNYIGFFSLSKEVANPMFYALLLSIVASALPHIPFVKKYLNIPYHIWKVLHFLMWPIFFVGIYHSFGTNSFAMNNPILAIYMYSVYIIGIYCFFYRIYLYKFFKIERDYKIIKIKRYNDSQIIELYLFPRTVRKRKLRWKPGQFAFFKFEREGFKESHPFTISNMQNINGLVRISVKVLGDWTNKVFTNIKDNTNVIIEGSYGDFLSKKRRNNLEIWIAGGIGITPYLAMLEDYKKNNNEKKNILFIWTVKDKNDAIYKEEINKNLPKNIEFNLHESDKQGRLLFSDLEDKINSILDGEKMSTVSLFICGPVPMREAIIKDAKKMNIKHIYYEEFNFR